MTNGTNDAGNARTATTARTATIRTTHEAAATVAAALDPDNTDSMRTTASDGRVTTRIERDTTGGLQSTVDDYVVNLTVAEAVIDRANAHVDGVADAADAGTDSPADARDDAPPAGEDAQTDDTQP